MGYEPRLLGMVKQEDEQQEFLELEDAEESLVSWPVAVGHSGVGVGVGIGDVWIVEESGAQNLLSKRQRCEWENANGCMYVDDAMSWLPIYKRDVILVYNQTK